MYMLTVSYSCIQIPNDIFNLEPTKYYGLKLSGWISMDRKNFSPDKLTLDSSRVRMVIA